MSNLRTLSLTLLLTISLFAMTGCGKSQHNEKTTNIATSTTTTSQVSLETTDTTTSADHSTITKSNASTKTTRTTKTTTPSRSGAWVITTTTSPEQNREVIDPLTGKPRYVIRVAEEYNGIGLKAIVTYWSDGSATAIVECQYCHDLPCPYGGEERCPQYDIKLDYTKTCYYCGRPLGDGYNGTCLSQTDWDNGGKHICNHYD